MCNCCSNDNHGMPRRDFIKTVGVSMAGVSLGVGEIIGSERIVNDQAPEKKISDGVLPN